MAYADSRPPPMLNLDVLALSLLCCLLASVVAVLLTGAENTPPLPSEAAKSTMPQETPDWVGLRSRSADLHARALEIDRSHERIAGVLKHAAVVRENAALAASIGELGDKIALMEKIRTAKVDAARLERKLEEKRKAANPAMPEAKSFLGTYSGPYVLIECVEGAAVVYPGKERLEMKPSKQQFDKLMEQIVRAGFVAFAVRPGGWFLDSYDELRPRVYEQLSKVEKETGRRIGRSTFPLDASEPIANYLPSGT